MMLKVVFLQLAPIGGETIESLVRRTEDAERQDLLVVM